MLTCQRTCSRMLWTVPHRPWKNTILRRTSLPSSRKSLTRSTTPPGTALWDVTLAATSHMRPSISSTSTLAKWRSCCSNQDKLIGADIIMAGNLGSKLNIIHFELIDCNCDKLCRRMMIKELNVISDTVNIAS